MLFGFGLHQLVVRTFRIEKCTHFGNASIFRYRSNQCITRCDTCAAASAFGPNIWLDVVLVSNIENEKERTRVKTKTKPSFIHWAFDVQLFKWHETEIAFKEMLRKQDTWLPGVEAAHYTIFIHLSIQLLFFSWEAEYHETWAFPCCSLHFLPFSCFVPRIPHTHALFSISLHNSFNPKRCNLICYLFETVIFSFETAEY